MHYTKILSLRSHHSSADFVTTLRHIQNPVKHLQWYNLTLTWQFLATNLCLRTSKFRIYVCLVARLGKQLYEKLIFKSFQVLFDKLVSILINIIQHEQYFFSFQTHVSDVCLFLSKSFHIMLKSRASSLG